MQKKRSVRLACIWLVSDSVTTTGSDSIGRFDVNVFFSVTDKPSPAWCTRRPCNETIMAYCLNGQMLHDHCCCEARHARGKYRRQWFIRIEAFASSTENHFCRSKRAANAKFTRFFHSFPWPSSILSIDWLIHIDTSIMNSNFITFFTQVTHAVCVTVANGFELEKTIKQNKINLLSLFSWIKQWKKKWKRQTEFRCHRACNVIENYNFCVGQCSYLSQAKTLNISFFATHVQFVIKYLIITCFDAISFGFNNCFGCFFIFFAAACFLFFIKNSSGDIIVFIMFGSYMLDCLDKD